MSPYDCIRNSNSIGCCPVASTERTLDKIKCDDSAIVYTARRVEMIMDKISQIC